MSDAGQRIPEKEWRKQHSLAWAGSVSLDELWRFDNERDRRQHATLLRLQGCPAERAISAYAREQTRQAASWERKGHISRKEPEPGRHDLVLAVSDKVQLEEVLDAIDPVVAQVLTHRYLLQRSEDDVARDLGVPKRTQSRILRDVSDVGYEWWDKVRRGRHS